MSPRANASHAPCTTSTLTLAIPAVPFFPEPRRPYCGRAKSVNRPKPAPGFEPGTPSLRVKCSGQLSYAGGANQFRGREVLVGARRRGGEGGKQGGRSIGGLDHAMACLSP